MKTLRAALVVVSFVLATPVGAFNLRCPHDSVPVGATCVDKYEASAWQIPPSNTALIQSVRNGRATLGDLMIGGATPLGCLGDFDNPQSPYPDNFPPGGNWMPLPGANPPSPGVYAVSVAGVLPSTCIDWFQAAQACALSGKRLLTNQEWQLAAAGTPDPGNDDDFETTCNTAAFGSLTGSRASCKSNWGAFDMIGNVWEWGAEWLGAADQAVNCAYWTTDDLSCVGVQAGSLLPGALARGGRGGDFSGAGVFATMEIDPRTQYQDIGFRCAR